MSECTNRRHIRTGNAWPSIALTLFGLASKPVSALGNIPERSAEAIPIYYCNYLHWEHYLFKFPKKFPYFLKKLKS